MISLSEIIRTKPWSFIFEVTQKCNCNCLYCYNVWKCNPNYPRGEVDRLQLISIINKLKKETKVKLLSISGGEPLLRADITEIIKLISNKGINTNLITNGTLLDERTVKNIMKAGISLFEIPLLSSKREVHNGLMRTDAFDRIVNGIATVKEYDGKVVTSFVATKLNIKDIENTVELAFALGVDGIMFNRFNPGGEGLRYIDLLLPNVKEIRQALEILNKVAPNYNMFISSQIPIPPCLIDLDEYPNINHGFCPLGTKNVYYTIDPMANVRICNHSSTIIGNLFEQSFKEIQESTFIKKYIETLPDICANCKYKLRCNGCCRASAEVCYGDINTLDPFVKCNMPNSYM